MKIKTALFVILVTGIFAMGYRCDSINTASICKTEFIPPGGSNTTYQQTKRFFLLIPGDTALLFGTAACTLLTNGIITSATTDSIYFRTITRPEERLSVNDTVQVVSPQLCQSAAKFQSLDDSGIVHYYKRTASGLFLLAQKQNGLLSYIPKEKQTVVPNPMDMGSWKTNSPLNNWATYPLFSSPIRDFEGMQTFEARSTATAAIALEKSAPAYKVRDCYYYDGVEIMTYCSMTGSGKKAGKDAVVIGTIVIKSHYFKDMGLIDQFQRWYIQTNYGDGHTEILKKGIWFGRGPVGAPVYPDFDTSTVKIETAADPLRACNLFPERRR